MSKNEKKQEWIGMVIEKHEDWLKEALPLRKMR